MIRFKKFYFKIIDQNVLNFNFVQRCDEYAFFFFFFEINPITLRYSSRFLRQFNLIFSDVQFNVVMLVRNYNLCIIIGAPILSRAITFSHTLKYICIAETRNLINFISVLQPFRTATADIPVRRAALRRRLI